MMLIQISSGQGPSECQRVVYLVHEKILKELKSSGLTAQTVDLETGREKNCFKSITLFVDGELQDFREQWEGTIAWRGKSPFRPFHKRQNWFIKISFCSQKEADTLDESQLKFESYRSTKGPGGQHVNKSATAVRLTHLPTGDVVECSSERSQFQNKQIAVRRLKMLLAEKQKEQTKSEIASRRQEHYQLQRGNATQSFSGKL